MGIAALVAGVVGWAAVVAMAQTPPSHGAQRFDNLKERKPEQGTGQPARQGVAAPMNMRIHGDGLALPQGVGRDADEQREEQKERGAAPAAAPATGETTKKP